MRILVVSNLYPPVQVGGYERRCADTVEALARKHEVHVLTSRGARRASGHDEKVLRELVLLTEDWHGTLRAPLASLHAARKMRRLLGRLRPDLLFVWNASRIPRAAILAAGELGYPLAFSVADPWFGSFVQGDQFLRYLSGKHRGIRRAWAVISKLTNRMPALRIKLDTQRPVSIAWNSNALRRMTPIPQSFTPALERVIYPATSHQELFAGIERSPAAIPVVAYIGRIEPQKAPDVAVRALALLSRQHHIEGHLVVVGSGQARHVSALQRLADELGVAERVQLRGQLAPPAVAQVLSSAHVLVVPSRWQEPFGLVCLEGALARVPLVVSLSGGMPEILERDREALFFGIDDVTGCAQALAHALTDKAATAERVRAAYERAQGYSKQRHDADQEAFVLDTARVGQPAPGEG